MADFADHFSDQAAAYARYRPRYPAELFDFLAAISNAHELAWDCATGSGQAALGLAEHFERVCATDASADQIEAAAPHPQVTYRVARAAQSPLDNQSADLVTIAQALHWLNLDRFYPEVRRVLKPDGVVAAWTYTLFHAPPEDPAADAIDAVLEHFYHEIIGPHWPPERRHIEAGYQTLAFPFEELETPNFTLVMEWSCDDVLGYLRTWSATKNHREATGEDPVARIEGDLAGTWGTPGKMRRMQWPVVMRAGRV